MSANQQFVKHLSGGRTPSLELSQAVTNQLRNSLTELCVNRFKWTGLPPTINERYLELALHETGACYFFEHPVYGYLALRGAGDGMNMYGEPTHYNLVGPPLVFERLPAHAVVPIYANTLRTPDLPTVLMYAERLANIDISINVNTFNARQPRVVAADENTQLSMANFSRQVDMGVPVIKVDRKMDPNANIVVLNMDIDPNVFDKLGIARNRVFNEAMSALGINNSNQDKKERMVVGEVSANDEQVAVMRAVSLNQRQLAAEKITKMIGSEVTVDFDPDILVPAGDTEGTIGGGENGDVHNDA